MKRMLIGWIMITGMLTSCDDEIVSYTEKTDRIGYSVSIGKESWQAATRVDGVERVPQVSVSPIDQTQGRAPFYLHTIIEENKNDFEGNEYPITKGSITTTAALADIGVSAFVCNDATWIDSNAISYIQNEQSDRNSGWTTRYYWPKASRYIRFFAYAPFGEVTPAAGVCPPSFSFTVPEDVSAQPDLLVATAEYAGNYCQTADLFFHHALTAVQFKVAEEVTGLTVNKITIEGVKNSGTYTYRSGNAGNEHDGGVWSDVKSTTGEASTFELEFENGVKCSDDVDTETILTDDENTFFMMPQTLTAGAKVIIDATDEKGALRLSAVIGDDNGSKVWKKGERVVYKISFNDFHVEYVLNLSENSISIPFYGTENKTFTVQSYRQITRREEVTIEPVAWECSDWEQPTWIDRFEAKTTAGVANAEAVEQVVYSVIASEPNSISHANLKGLTSKGSAGEPFDLSYDYDGSSRYTSNSYVVSAPGYYKLPLVYGNAITNGENNVAAYHPASIKTDMKTTVVKEAEMYDWEYGEATNTTHAMTFSFLPHFTDHLGTQINSPWIVQSQGGRYTAASAELVWQDEPCLLTEIKLDDSGEYLLFRVREDCICEGNAVVAVKDASGRVMWSWHIWIAEETKRGTLEIENRQTIAVQNDASEVVEQLTENTFSIMKRHLGYCTGETKIYNERSTELTIRQKDEKGKRETLIIVQDDEEVSTVNNAVYYQYGRKDPVVGTQTGDGTDKPLYLNNRDRLEKLSTESVWTHETGVQKSTTTIADAILRPGVFFISNQAGNDGREPDTGAYDVRIFHWMTWIENIHYYYNLWNSTCDEVPMFSFHKNRSHADFFTELKTLIDCGVTKSIYDPCPPGFEMPRIDAFTGATYYGTNLGRYGGDTEIFTGWANVGRGFCDGNLTLEIYPTAMSTPGFFENTSAIGLQIPNLGHRTAEGGGFVEMYGKFGAALTGHPLCLQWGKEIESNRLYCQFARLYIQHSESEVIEIRPVATSDFDYAFPVMAAESGKNPLEQITK